MDDIDKAIEYVKALADESGFIAVTAEAAARCRKVEKDAEKLKARVQYLEAMERYHVEKIARLKEAQK